MSNAPEPSRKKTRPAFAITELLIGIVAVLVANAPLGEPVGTIFMRYATLAFE